MRSICKALKEQVEDAQFYWRVSARYRKSRLGMRNFTEEHPHVIENVWCRCKICEGSIFKSQKKQDVDAIVQVKQAEKYLQVQRRASCRYIGLKQSICNSEYQALQIQRLSQRYLQHWISEMCRYMRCQRLSSKALLFNSYPIFSQGRLSNLVN